MPHKHIEGVRQIVLAIQLCLLVICFPSESFGEGIFGLKKGMSVQEIKALNFGRVVQSEEDPDIWMVTEPSKPTGVEWAYFITAPEHGLFKIRFAWVVNSNSYGGQIKIEFDHLHGVLSEKYGEGVKIDKITDSAWSLPSLYMLSLERGARTLAWVQANFPDSNKWNLEAVFLEVKGMNGSEALLLLNYEFQGWEDYVNQQDSQF